MVDPIKSTVSEIKSELKISKIAAFIVMLIVVGFILRFLSQRFPAVANVNPLK